MPNQAVRSLGIRAIRAVYMRGRMRLSTIGLMRAPNAMANLVMI